ncbi:hypothetical protein J1N10_15800 [Carboxylicivirga sp. A043]|uniref:hypothetical protein n=1 Tax=Carboxylicivirga litoralis TaxID=2816963 RepID=UPI0021CB4A84|nr:hypothetical protein [Carboxylicivirga sp. A043]MCU4157441.1 hypothetical protein [Carboxylicivirga sp. A043]
MKKISLLILFLTSVVLVQAQVTFIVENSSSTQVFPTLQEAIDGAVDGDILYLPGGSFPSPSGVGKSLTWIGVGHYPSATEATGKTQITGTFTLLETADNTSLEGIHFTSHFYLGTSNETTNVDHVTIKRCRIDGNVRLKYNSDVARTDFIMSECVTMGEIQGNNATHALIEKTILSGRKKSIISMSQSNFDRLISTSPVENGSYGSSYCFQYVTNSTISNCLLRRAYNYWSPYQCTGNTFSYNVFAPGAFDLSGNTDNNNMESTVVIDEMLEAIGKLDAFDYSDDFHLKDGVVGINAASDGTNVGLYGGDAPAKVTAIPTTPHISSKSIATSTDDNAMLNVNITVEAQDN